MAEETTTVEDPTEGKSLEDIRSEIKTLRDVVDSESTKMAETAGSMKGSGADGDPIIVEEGQVEAFKAAAETRNAAQGVLNRLVEAAEGKGMIDLLDVKMENQELRAASLAMKAAAGWAGGEAPAEAKSLAAALTGSEEFKSALAQRTPEWNWNFDGDMYRKDMFTDLPTGDPSSFGAIQRDPIVTQLQRRVRIRDLFQVSRTNAAVIEFFRQTGFNNNASVVPERTGGDFTTKPQTDLEFEGVQAVVQTIAHFELASRNVLADEPQLRSIIQNELLYGLRLIEDDQILNGTGLGSDLLGILNAGISVYSESSGPASDNKADAIRRGMTLVMLAFAEPTGVVLHDSDWEDIELLKDSEGRYLFSTSIQQGGEPRIWRSPVVVSSAIDEGTALVGDFQIGAQLYDREESNIRFSESHADIFVRNAVAILAEQRLALATKRPEAFVDITFT